ncbi:signal peptidase II [Breznakibacter xylanolyticus]|uniref:Signal peptidase II n=2 Tax=Breznakibacter xylanolyticus TaxID=990 RepID=A0A2W7NPW1_9BACT|nr:signal peptidase II [Breznakibacter xylanolyticus]
MMLGDHFPILGDWFYIHFVENNGMAFGMEFFGTYGKLFLSVFRIVAVGAIGYYLYKIIQRGTTAGMVICVSLIMAGALGNIIDSAFYGMMFNHSESQIASLFPAEGGYASFLHGKVVDMFYFPIWQGRYWDWIPVLGGQNFLFFRPVFNVADSAITIGILSILLFQRHVFNEKH